MTTFLRSTSLACLVLPQHGRSSYQPEAQARAPRLRFGLVLINLVAGVNILLAETTILWGRTITVGGCPVNADSRPLAGAQGLGKLAHGA